MNPSELEEALQIRQHKHIVADLAQKIILDEKLFEHLISLLVDGTQPVPDHASWVLQHISDMEPQRILPYMSILIQRLQQPASDAVKRGIIRAFASMEMPDQVIGSVADLCFVYLENTKESIAVKVHAMTVLWKICWVVPDLSDELIMQIENQLPTGSTGFKNRGQKIINALRTGSRKLK